MSPWNCPRCHEEEGVERYTYDVSGDPAGYDTAKCSCCRAVFAVENDFDQDGETVRDCSTLGRYLRTGWH